MILAMISCSISMKVMWPSWDLNWRPLDLQTDTLTKCIMDHSQMHYGTQLVNYLNAFNSNLLWTEWSRPQYLLEDSNFGFRYVRLCDLDIPWENWLNYLQTVETLIRCCIWSGSTLFANYPFLGVSRLQWANN